MRRVTPKDINSITAIYADAIEHARQVGSIDWGPELFQKLPQFIATGELFCFSEIIETQELVVATARLSHKPDSLWASDVPNDASCLYLSKLATAQIVHRTEALRGYFAHKMLPAIARHAGSETTALRLDCLSDWGLPEFYQKAGFVAVKQCLAAADNDPSQLVSVTLMELPLP